MNLYGKIRKIVESWNIAITQDKNWNNRLWSSMWEWWIIRVSNSFESLDYCYYSLWFHYYHRFEIEEIEKKWEHYIWIYERPLWRPEIWALVQVIYKQEWTTIKKNFVYKVIEIKKLYCVVCAENGLWPVRYVAYDCIAPWVPIDK